MKIRQKTIPFFKKNGYLLTLLLFYFLLPSDAKALDTISKLELRVQKNLNRLQTIVQDESAEIQQLKIQINAGSTNKKAIKGFHKKLELISSQRTLHYQQQNAYRYILTTIRQLQYQNENLANTQIKELKIALNRLEKNKIPRFKKLPEISSNPYVRDNTMVYDKEVNSFCNLSQNLEGTILANVFEIFFEHTDPKIGSYFKESEFLQCFARFIKTKNDYLLELKFLLHSSKASQVYGAIDPSSPARIDFINGEHIYLQSYALTSATIEPETGNTIYNIQYKLDREDLKYLLKQEIDSYTIIWTSGSDRFEICKLDLLKNMLSCLQEKKLQN
ncbi:MAG: hypothetical protein IPL42_16865 [Saprospiraceae bacterium]|nr:hypothetical protein [Saprospiraceae bacterium]